MFGLGLLCIALFVMAMHGVGMGLGIRSDQKTEAIMAFSFYGSIAGLIWMAIYSIAVGAGSLRTLHGSQRRNRG